VAERGALHARRARSRHGSGQVLAVETEVLLYWEHRAHDYIEDRIVDRICQEVYDGMGFVPLHSAHISKPFKRLMGTPCSLDYRESAERERLWAVDPGHPIADGLGNSVVLPETEMYDEPFAVPEPDRLVFVSWFKREEVFRSGYCCRRGNGRIFYFRPGHETYPVHKEPAVQDILDNAVRWAAPHGGGTTDFETHSVDPPEP